MLTSAWLVTWRSEVPAKPCWGEQLLGGAEDPVLGREVGGLGHRAGGP